MTLAALGRGVWMLHIVAMHFSLSSKQQLGHQVDTMDVTSAGCCGDHQLDAVMSSVDAISWM